jgi:hypothetical protein
MRATLASTTQKENPTKRKPGGVEGKQEEMTTGEPAV